MQSGNHSLHSGPMEGAYKAPVNEQAPQVAQQRMRLPPMYPPRYQQARDKREEASAQQPATDDQALAAQARYVSDFANRTYGGELGQESMILAHQE